jgi:hypothetical protein
MERTTGHYDRITVHHSAEPDPVPLDGSAERTFEAVRDIQRAHMNGANTGYGDIGYHFLIDPYGRVLAGRDLAWQGAHAMGENNVRNVGVCLLGNFDRQEPSSAALEALRRLIEELRREHAIPRQRVYCHKDLRGTECPGRNLERWVVAYRGGAALTTAMGPERPGAARPARTPNPSPVRARAAAGSQQPGGPTGRAAGRSVQ